MTWLIIFPVAVPLLAVLVYYGLPGLLRLMGLHPHYHIPEFDLRGKRALIVTTSHDRLGDSGKATGVWGSEMTVPYYAFLDAGMQVDIASIKGGEVPVEPHSMGWPLATAEDYRFRKDAAALAKLHNSLPLAEVDISTYDAVFLSGGWGAAYDFAQSEELAQMVTTANSHGAVIGSVCHGALGLIGARDTDGSSLVEGRNVSGVTDAQIRQLGIDFTPKHPEKELRAAGANFKGNSGLRDFLATHVVVDGRLVTGQNQNSGAETAHRMLQLLSGD